MNKLLTIENHNYGFQQLTNKTESKKTQLSQDIQKNKEQSEVKA